MDENLGRNDPYRNMERGDIRPGFLAGGDKDEERDNAADGLRNAEDNAAKDDEGIGDAGLPGVAAGEEKAGGLYTGVGLTKGNKKGGKAKGFLKRKGPMGLIIGLILGVGGLMGGSQLLMPFSLVANFVETFNSMHISTKTRSNSFLNYQLMESGRVRNPKKGKIFGGEEFKITKSQAKRLAAQGIEYDADYNGKRVLKFDDGSGSMKIVTADAATARSLGGDAVDFDTLYKTNPDFYNGYNKGSMTWRGKISNWFDTITVKFLQSNKITRNLFKDFQEEVKARGDGNTKAAAIDIMAKNTGETEGGGFKSTSVDEEDPDSDSGGKKVNTEDVVPGDKNNASNMKQTVEVDDGKGGTKTETKKYKATGTDTSGGGKTTLTPAGVKSKLSSISGSVQKGANIACTVFNLMGAVSLLVTANEALQIINLVTSYFEAIDKTKAGEGDGSPVHELATTLTEKKENSHVGLVETGVSWDSSDESGNFGSGGVKTLKTTDPVVSEKSAMESNGITALYGGKSVDPNDPSVKSFNFTGNINRIFNGLGTSMELFEACAIAKLAASFTSAVLDAVEIAGCVLGLVGAMFTFGVSAGACSGLLWDAIKGIALSVAIGVVVSGIISTITPLVTSMLTRDLISNLGGEDLGNALTSGANMYMGNTHRANGGSLSNYDKYAEYEITKQAVIADDAKFERQNKSPFDATSKYTFLGTLTGSFANLLSVSSAMGAITSAGSVVSSSIASLDPSATAVSIAEHLPNEDEYKETCPYLWSIGAVGDAFCNPYAMTDVSTINEDPSTVIEKIDSMGNNFLDESTPEGNVKINGGSDLAKYIVYCDNRSSAFGITDQNIANEVSDFGTVHSGNAFVDDMSNGVIGAIPVLGDAIDVISNEKALANSGYISGESCVAGNNVSKSESPGWDKAKYYQRFIEDQSLAETMGLFGENGKSAVSAFLDEYYEQNPLDNSYEGILARYSGLTKETVVAVLDFVDYANYVAEYDASERYAFGTPVVDEPEEEMIFESENLMAGEYILLNNIAYADVRNRVNLV